MMWSIVSVPVLSVQSTSMAPRFWMELQPLDDDLLARHGDGALGQADGHDHRQHFRSQAHGHGHGEEERIAPVALGQAVDEEHQRRP